MASPNNDWVDEADWADEPASTTIKNLGVPNTVTPATAQDPHRSLLQKYAMLMNKGSPRGGMVGGILGQVAGGYPGMVAGAFLGNVAGQDGLTPEEQGLHPTGLVGGPRKPGEYRRPPPPRPPEPHTPDIDYGAAAADAGTQAATGGLLRWGLGPLAAKAGFPRLAGFLGAQTPQKMVAGVAPEAVKGVSTPALQAVDAAGLAGAPAAKEIAAISAEQAKRDAILAMERSTAQKSMGPIQARMPERVGPLAAKTKAFGEELFKAVPMEKVDKAFADTPSVLEAASSEPVMAARQQMIQEAMPQSLDSKALKLAGRPISAADARGVSASPVQHAADAAGLRELGGNMPMDNSFLSKLFASKLGGAAGSVIPKGGMSPARVTQTAAALLGERGHGTVNPAMESLVSNNPAYRASPSAQLIEDLLRRYGAK